MKGDLSRPSGCAPGLDKLTAWAIFARLRRKKTAGVRRMRDWIECMTPAGEGSGTSVARLAKAPLPVATSALRTERLNVLHWSVATYGGCGGLRPPAAWDTTALDVRHEPASFPCWRSACHSPGSHPPASVWLFRTSTRAHGGGRLPRVGRKPRGRRRRPAPRRRQG